MNDPKCTLNDRYTGCLLGLAIGDALGGPVEFLDRAEIARRFPDGLREFVGGGWLDLEPGEFTDDTQMALAIARSLAAFPEADLDDIASRFVEWAATGPKDIGNTTRASISLLAAGHAWDEAGEIIYRQSLPVGAAGNGSIMRCAPVAMRFRRDLAALRRVSQESARTTHADPRCVWSAVAINQAIANLLDGHGLESALDAAVTEIENQEVVLAIQSVPTAERDAIQSGGFVLDTLTAALWSVSQSHNFEEAVVTAVGLGDDADTTGAVAGALAGALYGSDNIPERWRHSVQSRDEIYALSRQLLELSLA